MFSTRAAYDLALSVASGEALDRLYTKGRQLAFVDDELTPWGPGWEFSFGLQYTEVGFLKHSSAPLALVLGILMLRRNVFMA